MKISPITNNTVQRYNIPQKTYTNNPVENKNNISFSGIHYKDLVVNTFGLNPLKNFKNFSPAEYNTLSECSLSRLRKAYRKLESKDFFLYEGIAEIHDFAATAMQTVFDNRFGKNNYVVLPIGRSLSSIGKVLGYKIGENNVVNIPMSDARRFFTAPYYMQYQENLNKVTLLDPIDKFLDYLAKRNLSRKDIETSGKNYILTDYCVSGLSLEGAEQIFKSELVWGNKKKNIFAVDFLKLLDAVTYDKNSLPETLKNYPDIPSRLKNILFSSRYKPYSFVGSANFFYKMKDNSSEKIISVSDKATKLVWFHMLDYEMSNRGINRFSIKPAENKPFLHIEGQKLEPWHDIQSQYESDIRNDLNEINKNIIRFNAINAEEMSASDTKQYRNNKLNLYNLYNQLTEILKQQNDRRMIYIYYAYRKNLAEDLAKISSYLSQIGNA